MSDEQQRMITALVHEHYDNMNEWEQGFIENLDARDDELPLSAKQAEKLEDIWEKYNK